MKRKEKGRREERKKRRKLSLSTAIFKREMWQRQRNFIIRERESARKEGSRTYLRFFIRCIRGKVNCPPPPPPAKFPEIASFIPHIENTTTTTTFTLFSVFEHWQCLTPPPPPHPPSPFPFRCHVCIHTIMISLFQPSVLSCLWTLETFRF